MIDAFGIERPDLISKQEKKASSGRLVLGGMFPGFHGVVAGKKGRKLRAAGNEAVGGMAGGVAGATIGGIAGAATRNPRIATGASNIGTIAGSIAGTQRAQSRGHYTKQR